MVFEPLAYMDQPTCFRPDPRREAKNCGPTLYPIANRNRRKNTCLSGPGTGISSCPTSTPTRRTDVTVPSENDLYLNRPIQNPRPSVRKIAIAGFSLSVSTNQFTTSMCSRFNNSGTEMAHSVFHILKIKHHNFTVSSRHIHIRITNIGPLAIRTIPLIMPCLKRSNHHDYWNSTTGRPQGKPEIGKKTFTHSSTYPKAPLKTTASHASATTFKTQHG